LKQIKLTGNRRPGAQSENLAQGIRNQGLLCCSK